MCVNLSNSGANLHDSASSGSSDHLYAISRNEAVLHGSYVWYGGGAILHYNLLWHHDITFDPFLAFLRPRTHSLHLLCTRCLALYLWAQELI